MSSVELVAAHRPYGLDCKCGRPINSDMDWARHFIEAVGFTEETATVPELVGAVEHAQPCDIPDTMIASEEMHTCGYRRGHFEFPTKRRLVGGWLGEQQEARNV